MSSVHDTTVGLRIYLGPKLLKSSEAVEMGMILDDSRIICNPSAIRPRVTPAKASAPRPFLSLLKGMCRYSVGCCTIGGIKSGVMVHAGLSTTVSTRTTRTERTGGNPRGAMRSAN